MPQDKSSEQSRSEGQALALVFEQLNQQTLAIAQLTQVVTEIALELSRDKQVIRQNNEIVGVQ